MAALGSCKTNGQGGMSVIGWNHPGFGASSGSPDPRSEAEAIDAVLEFAQARLGYAIGEITLRAPQPTHTLHSCCRRRMTACRLGRVRRLVDWRIPNLLGGDEPPSPSRDPAGRPVR